jgi:hypothetical protein
VTFISFCPHDLQAYTDGKGVDYPGFYTTDNFERAANFLEWMAERIHTNEAYWTVGMLQVMNEPVHANQYPSEAAYMISDFYPRAWQRIRDAEARLGVADADLLHIQFMVRAPFPLDIHDLVRKKRKEDEYLTATGRERHGAPVIRRRISPTRTLPPSTTTATTNGTLR